MSPAEWIRALGDRDPSVPIALAAIARAAGLSDLVEYSDLVMAYREAHIAVYRALPGHRPLPGPGQSEITGDEVRAHLTGSVLPRLATEGWILDSPDGEWMQIRPRVPWWGQTSEARQEVYAELLAAATRAVQRAHSLVPQKASASVLEGIDLSKSFKGRRVVDRVTVRVQQGEIVGLLGPNGAGKTTTFYLITGLIRPDAGRVLLDGLDLTRAPMYRRARSGIGHGHGWIFEQPGLAAVEHSHRDRQLRAALVQAITDRAIDQRQRFVAMARIRPQKPLREVVPVAHSG